MNASKELLAYQSGNHTDARTGYQIGYKLGLARFYNLPDRYFFGLPYEKWHEACRIHKSDTGMDYIPFSDQ
jgi:hypothetical protein